MNMAAANTLLSPSLLNSTMTALNSATSSFTPSWSTSFKLAFLFAAVGTAMYFPSSYIRCWEAKQMALIEEGKAHEALSFWPSKIKISNPFKSRSSKSKRSPVVRSSSPHRPPSPLSPTSNSLRGRARHHRSRSEWGADRLRVE